MDLYREMKAKRKLLTEQQFGVLSKVQGWKVFEVPREQWGSIPGVSRLEDTIAIMGSANIYDRKLLNQIQSVAGFDQLVHETNPHNGEPEGNAYHYVVQQISNSNYPFILHGPYRTDANINHWFQADDLDEYLKDNKSK